YDAQGASTSVVGALNKVQNHLSRMIDLGQVQGLMLSTHLSSRQFNDALTGLAELPLLNKTPYVLVTSQPVETVMTHQTPQQQLPTLYYHTVFNCDTCYPAVWKIRLWQVLDRLNTPGIDLVLPQTGISSEGYRLSQVALYRKTRYITTLSPNQTRTLAFLEGVAANETLPLPHHHGTLYGIHGSRTLSVSVSAPHTITATVHLNLKGSWISSAEYDPSNAQIAAIAHNASQRILSQSLALLQKTRTLDVDPLGIGRQLSWTDPQAFQQMRPWHRQYPHVHFVVDCHFTVQKLGSYA
ncbi:MAG: hypothetical protein OWS74_00195, partial [Firmicutes bacterium]|nr:hypothetical protein [Bacillota bacterium]